MAEATPKEGPLPDDELISFLQQSIRQSVGFSTSRLSTERTKVARYYDSDEPKRLHNGNSGYVSQDVYDSVESQKANLLETFTGNTRPVTFAPQGQDDIEMARIATEYVNFVVFRQNNGYDVFHDVIHDGLTARVGIAQVDWVSIQDKVPEQVAGVPMEVAQQILVQAAQTHKIEEAEITPDESDDTGQTFKVSYTRLEDLSQVIIEAVPPEEFGITPRSKDMRSADVVFRRVKRTKSQLIKEGYDSKLLNDIWEDDKVWLDTEPEVLQRFEATDDYAYLGTGNEPQDAKKHLIVYDAYTELDTDGSNKAQLWRIVFAGNRILKKQRVTCHPFLAFCPLRRPHSFWGDNFAARVIQTQNTKTILTRAVVDHAAVTTNPKYGVVRGGLLNPKELLENRLGGIVNVTRPDAVFPFQQANLNPFIFQVLQMLDHDKEETTGISSLSQGLNKDVISKQNSADLVQQMVTVSQQRQKIIARNFANGFMKELFLRVYQLVIENETREHVLEVAGNWVPVDPQKWRERRDVLVEFSIGYGEADKEAQQLVQMDEYLAAQPGLQGGYTYQERYNLLSKAADLKGYRNFANYLKPPNQVQPPQPDPMMVLEAQLKQRDMAIKERAQQLAEQKFQAETALKQQEMQLKAGHNAANTALKARKQVQDENMDTHQMVVDAAEIGLQRQANHISATAAVHKVTPSSD